MRCLFPLPAIYSEKSLNKVLIIPRAKPEDTFSPCVPHTSKYSSSIRLGGKMLHLRCGKCMSCKISKSEEWSVRCVHEAREHQHNMFVTLTYAPEQAPCLLTKEERLERDRREKEEEERAKAEGRRRKVVPPLRGLDRPKTLFYQDFQDFMKRLRRYATTHYGSEVAKEISYLVCGEYTKAGVPHFHAIIFGIRMNDMIPVGRGKKVKNHNQRYRLYGSKTLENLWSHGFITIGEVNEHTSSYVAQYTTKKLRSGEESCKTYDQHFHCYNQKSDGTRTEYYEDGRRKEFMKCSLKKPIGMRWLNKLSSIEDIYVRGNDNVVFVNKKGKVRFIKPPRFYDRICERYFPKIWEDVKKKREQRYGALPPPTYEMFVSAFNVQQYNLSSKRESRDDI